MKSSEEIKLYKRMYYLNNKYKLCQYSRNYYTYQKCKGDISNEDISKEMAKFLKTYKKHKTINDIDQPCKCKIIKEPIIISFS